MLSVLLSGCSKKSKYGDLDFLPIESDTLLAKVFANARQYELQVSYIQIDRKEDGSIDFLPYEFNIDSTTYFYPASTVKMPVAFLALEKLNQLYKDGHNVDFNTALQIEAPRSPPQSAVNYDSTAQDNLASIGHYVHKLFVVSDNDAYNRLYEFVGPEAINKKLRSRGIFGNSRIVHRVGISGFSPEENRHTNPFKFYDEEELVYEQGASYMEEPSFESLKGTSKGVAYMNGQGEIVDSPFDFSQKNFIALKDLQKSMLGVLFPKQFPSFNYDLSQQDYDLLYKSMSISPLESTAPIYPDSTYYDSYVKFLMFGDDESPMPDHIRIFNKVGFAYGYLTDCAYIVDFKNNVDFLLAASIHVNENQTYNDGVYEYDDIGIPFLAKLGKLVYDYELSRERETRADLSRFIVDYD